MECLYWDQLVRTQANAPPDFRRKKISKIVLIVKNTSNTEKPLEAHVGEIDRDDLKNAAEDKGHTSLMRQKTTVTPTTSSPATLTTWRTGTMR